MSKKIKVDLRSEIGKLEAVVIHTPGHEVENMTPGNAERALYSDILNLPVARKEYDQLKGILQMFTNTFEVRDLVKDILNNQKVKETLIKRICKNENKPWIIDRLLSEENDNLCKLLIEGVVMEKNNLTKFLSKERYSLPPLHNFFYVRDSAIPVCGNVLLSKMANKVRERESIIMESIFDFSNNFITKTQNPLQVNDNFSHSAIIEGGDVLVAREDILLIGNGSRTSTQGIDCVLELLRRENNGKKHIIVQEMPYSPESFIHLDMVFTFLDVDTCMIYEPVLFKLGKYQTVHIIIDNGKVKSIREEKNILEALKGLGMDLKPIFCGGTKDPWVQEREQWHSGANFFAVEPGKVIGYGRNNYTMEELSRNGFEIYNAKDIIKNRIDPHSYNKIAISLEGSELPRGGGGARCMTMPVKRSPVKWN